MSSFRCLRFAFPVVASILISCVDATQATAPRSLPGAPMDMVVSMRGTVDLEAGTLTFESVAPRPGSLGGASAVSAAVYGNQGVTVRIYNSPVVVTSAANPARKLYTAAVGIRNLNAYPIGDEQAGPTPDDTTGIFVFVNGGPTVTRTSSPCSPACSISVANADGRFSFNAPNQPFWYWHDRLTAAGGLRDTTLVRREWSFEADTQVTGFTFDVLVSAAWPPPYQTRWKIDYTADGLPHLAGNPKWTRTMLLGTEAAAIEQPGQILLTSPINGSQTFERRDSVGPATDVYMEARVRLNVATSKAEVSFGFFDGARFIAVGINGTRAGFVDNGFNSPGVSVATTTSAFRTYRLRKFGTDSVQLLIDGTRVLTRSYSAFSITPTATTSYFEFGNPGPSNKERSQSGNSSSWDYVVYEIGATQP